MVPSKARRLLRAARLPLALLAVAALTAVLPVAPAAAAGRHRAARMTARIVAHLNAIRAARGLPRLRRNRALSRAAAQHSREMVRYRFFSHASVTGRPLSARVRARHVGETLAWAAGRPTSRRIVRLWMHSPPHRATLLSPGFRAIGVAPVADRLLGHRGTVVTADLAG